jgi:NAD-dependent dihydropyrimidine dehydrogenase PreA subunit
MTVVEARRPVDLCGERCRACIDLHPRHSLHMTKAERGQAAQ